MGKFKLSSKQKLIAIICISFSFFVAELVVAFFTKSLALLADAFHYMNDLIAYCVALAAIIISDSKTPPDNFSFGWARAQLLGAFFNGVFLLALGISIFLQSIERFISIERVDNPVLVLIMGCVGFTLNLLSATLLHELHDHDHGHGHGHGHSHSHSDSDEHEHAENHGHGHDHHHGHVNVEAGRQVNGSFVEDHDEIPLTPISAHAEHRHTIVNLQSSGHDLGMMGVLLHVIGDACNNVGVIIAALIIWLTSSEARFYADPGISMGIAIMILVTSIPLVKNSGKILMQSSPKDVPLDDVKHDLEKIPGIESVHELHIWRLDQKKSIATAHIVVSNTEMSDFMDRARTVGECLHAWGIHSATLQPELATPTTASSVIAADNSNDNEERISTDNTATSPVVETGGIVSSSGASIRRRRIEMAAPCQIACGNLCEGLTCCNKTTMRI
ncbi:cation efflux protein [Annulohypoxylon maeteangense]|uniref:cation efflux protein n=1 Tax=Annulohypoxylon maeteangense TaxID=1927788 RepID=UPI0020074DAA|nr:cation efflux protein [Annulohypoxylon maeteangense]KAI0888806.1 cation efflux protein [Annulohypoxylon maeteangense]